MNYIYDILLNFNEKFYEFYDWNKEDTVLNIRRIPIFRVDSEVINDLKNNIVILDNNFLNCIKNKTEYYDNRNIKLLKYAFLLTDTFEILGVNVEQDIKYSSLQIDEELDILEETNIRKINLNYKKIKKIYNQDLKTRKQEIIEKVLKDNLKNLETENNLAKIRYIYFECFNEKENDKEKILKRLYSSINDKYILDKLNEFFNSNKLTFN